MVSGNWKPPTKGETTEDFMKKYIKQCTVREMGIRHLPPIDCEIPKTKTIKKRTWGIILAILFFTAFTSIAIMMVGVLKVILIYTAVALLFGIVSLIVDLIMSEDE